MGPLMSERVPDRGERGVRVGADGLNGRQTDHDNQGQHDRVLDGGRTVFGNQELFDAVGEVFHGCSLCDDVVAFDSIG